MIPSHGSPNQNQKPWNTKVLDLAFSLDITNLSKNFVIDPDPEKVGFPSESILGKRTNSNQDHFQKKKQILPLNTNLTQESKLKVLGIIDKVMQEGCLDFPTARLKESESEIEDFWKISKIFEKEEKSLEAWKEGIRTMEDIFDQIQEEVLDWDSIGIEDLEENEPTSPILINTKIKF